MTTTEIVSTVTAGKIALRNGEKTLLQVAETLIAPPAPLHVPSTEPEAFPAVPETKVLTAEDKQALLDLPKVFGKVNLETRRTLGEAEIKKVYVEQEVLKRIVKVLAGREDNLKEFVRTHVDVDHEERGMAVKADVLSDDGEVIVEATPRDKSGHYIFATPGNPTRVNIPGTNKAYSLEYNKGRSGEVYIDDNALLDLYETGEITREQYLALTRERRVFDERKAEAACAKDEALLEVIARVTRRKGETAPGTALNIRAAN